MSLHLTARLASRNLDVELHIGETERVALLGPNGAGKSTIVSLIAGLTRPDSGSANLSGSILFGDGTWTPPHQRPVAVLSQDPLLFPHLSVRDNVGFGPRSRGCGKRESRSAADRWLTAVGAEQFTNRRPETLSGGEAQRVALARALAAEPELLLLDEPMASLDVDVAAAMRQTLSEVLANRMVLIVTHNILDALLLAERVIVLDRGKISEDGPTLEVLSRPTTAFTAKLAGLNLISGHRDGSAVSTADLRVEGMGAEETPAGSPALAVFRPNAVAVFPHRPEGSPRNAFPVTVTEVEPQGHLVRVRAGNLAADVTPTAVAELGLRPGANVWFAVKATEVTLYPAP